LDGVASRLTWYRKIPCLSYHDLFCNHKRIQGYIFGEASCFEARRAESGMGSAGGLRERCELN